MSLSSILLALWLILVGATWLTWITVATTTLGLLGFIVGIVILIDSIHPISFNRP